MPLSGGSHGGLGHKGGGTAYALTFSVWFERAECEFSAPILVKQLIGSRSCCFAHNRKSSAPKPIGSEWPPVGPRRQRQAVRTARECLQMFGIELPERPTADQVRAEYEAVWSDLGSRPSASLLSLPLTRGSGDARGHECLLPLSPCCLLHRRQFLPNDCLPHGRLTKNAARPIWLSLLTQFCIYPGPGFPPIPGRRGVRSIGCRGGGKTGFAAQKRARIT